MFEHINQREIVEMIKNEGVSLYFRFDSYLPIPDQGSLLTYGKESIVFRGKRGKLKDNEWRKTKQFKI